MEKKGYILLFVGIFSIVFGSVLTSFNFNYAGMATFILAILILFYSVIILNKKDNPNNN